MSNNGNNNANNNANNNHNDDWSTLGSESVTTAESSFVNVPDPNEHPVLTVEVLAQNETVGFFSPQKTSKSCVTVKAMIDEISEDSRPPVDIMLTMDKSSSMHGDKIKDCKLTIETVSKHLTSRDRLGLVSFSSNVTLEVPLRNMTPENKEALILKAKTLQADGSTNLSGGLSLAAMEMAQIEKPNPVRSIFLLTDGHANVGIRDATGLVTMAKNLNHEELPAINEMALSGDDGNNNHIESPPIPPRIVVANAKPTSLFCFGYGGNHNSQMLQAISDATPGGAYYFVERDSDVADAFGDAMGGLLSVVGQSAYVHISVPPEAQLQGVKILKVHHKQAVKRSETSYTVNLGDFYAEESRDVIVDVQLSTGTPNPEPLPHLKVTLNYMDTVNKKPAAFGPVEYRVQRPPNNDVSPSNEHVEIQWLRIRTAEAIEEADAQARGNNLTGARSLLQNAMSSITTSPVYSTNSPMVFAMQTDVQDVLNGFRSAEQYRSVGTHYATNKCAYMSKQRCMESRGSTYNVFRSKRKGEMSLDFRSKKDGGNKDGGSK